MSSLSGRPSSRPVGAAGAGRAVVALTALCLAVGLAARAEDGRSRDRSSAAQKAIPLKVLRYAQRVVERNDRDGDGVLKGEELGQLKVEVAELDRDGDGSVTVDEVAEYIFRYARRRRVESVLPRVGTHGFTFRTGASGSGKEQRRGSSRTRRFYVDPSVLPKGLPSWFRSRDRDGDGQLSLAEFAPNLSESLLKLFAKYDRNGDGFLVPEELLAAARRESERQSEERESGEGASERARSRRAEAANEEEEEPAPRRASESGRRPGPTAGSRGVPERPLVGLRPSGSRSDRFETGRSGTSGYFGSSHRRTHSERRSSSPGPSWLPEEIRSRWRELSPQERREILAKYRRKRLEELKKSASSSDQIHVPSHEPQSRRNTTKRSRSEKKLLRSSSSSSAAGKSSRSKLSKSKLYQRSSQQKTRSKTHKKRSL